MADLAGVSKQTVSNILSGRGRFGAETEARVRQAIEELGFAPNLVARSLATGSTQTMGLFVPTVASYFYSEVVEEVENVLQAHGYHLTLCTTRSDGERARSYLSSLTSRSVDALLIAGDRDLIDHLPLLKDAKFPVALCAWETDLPDTLPVVTIDYEHAGFLAGRHLRELGHTRAAVITELPAHAKRAAGFWRGFAGSRAQAAGLTVEAPESSLRGGLAATVRVLDQQPDTTAIFATHDVLAVGVLEAVKRAGRSVPGDVSVVGLDDIAQLADAEPALTTVAIPKREMAQQAVDLLLHAVDERRLPTNAVSLLRPFLIERESTGMPAQRA
ncbi:MAG TPA: LacI family DNA-binding transcriptional regulator [Actinospica sp.]|nr:LacI family DNA-binding transcriptional regulator [Actinospica sp.]